MNRTEFEALRDLPGKRIREDIRFSQRRATQPSIVAEDIRIENDAGADLRLMISYNPEVGSTTINVHVPGTGPICRLDIDGHRHGSAGRCHKHSVQGERCPDRNLPDGTLDRSDLSGSSVREIFTDFCARAQIVHEGAFEPPDEPVAISGSSPPPARPSARDDGGET